MNGNANHMFILWNVPELEIIQILWDIFTKEGQTGGCFIKLDAIHLIPAVHNAAMITCSRGCFYCFHRSIIFFSLNVTRRAAQQWEIYERNRNQ